MACACTKKQGLSTNTCRKPLKTRNLSIKTIPILTHTRQTHACSHLPSPGIVCVFYHGAACRVLSIGTTFRSPVRARGRTRWSRCRVLPQRHVHIEHHDIWRIGADPLIPGGGGGDVGRHETLGPWACRQVLDVCVGVQIVGLGSSRKNSCRERGLDHNRLRTHITRFFSGKSLEEAANSTLGRKLESFRHLLHSTCCQVRKGTNPSALKTRWCLCAPARECGPP
jgi:hypothetical protein